MKIYAAFILDFLATHKGVRYLLLGFLLGLLACWLF